MYICIYIYNNYIMQSLSHFLLRSSSRTPTQSSPRPAAWPGYIIIIIIYIYTYLHIVL